MKKKETVVVGWAKIFLTRLSLSLSLSPLITMKRFRVKKIYCL